MIETGINLEFAKKVALAVIKEYWLMCPGLKEAEIAADKIIAKVLKESAKSS